MNRPRLFLSAVSTELGSARLSVAATVRMLGFDPVSQDDFPTGHGELRRWLREQIDACEGLVQIAGLGYGAEPPDVDAEFGRVSYTQFEFLYAQSKAKKTWLLIAGQDCKRDTAIAQLDLPREPNHPDPEGYQAERRQLQQAYIARLKTENHLRHTAENDTDLELKIYKLKDELSELRRHAERQHKRLFGMVIAIFCGLLVLGSGGWWAYQQLYTSVEQAGVVNTEKIRAHLQETVAATHRRELAAAEQSPDWKDRQRLKEAAEAAHAVRLAKIDELAASFADIEESGTATGVFQEMTRIMAGPGVDAAIAYVAGQRATILQTVRARAAALRERNRADLQPLLKAAALHESKGQPGEARALYADVLGAEPDWPEALDAYFWFLTDQGDAALVHATLADALREYDEAHRLALRLTAGDPGNTEWQRDLSVSYNKLGDVAVAQGKLDDAAQAYRDGLAIRNKLAAGDPGNTEWQRDLFVSYIKLGDVAVAQGRLEDAARAYRDGLTMANKLAAGDPGNTQWQRDLSVSYNKLGDVAVAQGKLDDAARAYRDGLAIRNKLTAGDPGNTEWQRDLSASFYKISKLQAQQKFWPDAMVNAEACFKIAEHLSQLDRSNVTWQKDVQASRAWLDALKQKQAHKP